MATVNRSTGGRNRVVAKVLVGSAAERRVVRASARGTEQEVTTAIQRRSTTIVQAVHFVDTGVDLGIGANLTDQVAGVKHRIKRWDSRAISIAPAVDTIQGQGDQLAGELSLAPTAIADAL